VREFLESRALGGARLPSKKGIALTPEQWAALRDQASSVDDAVAAATSALGSATWSAPEAGAAPAEDDGSGFWNGASDRSDVPF